VNLAAAVKKSGFFSKIPLICGEDLYNGGCSSG